MASLARRAFASRAALATGVLALAACTRTIIHEPPAPSTLRTVAGARFAMDSAQTRLLVRNGMLDTIAFLDSLPAAEVVSFALVSGSAPLNAPPRMVALVSRCSDADTIRALLRRTIVRRFAHCPWSTFPRDTKLAPAVPLLPASGETQDRLMACVGGRHIQIGADSVEARPATSPQRSRGEAGLVVLARSEVPGAAPGLAGAEMRVFEDSISTADRVVRTGLTDSAGAHLFSWEPRGSVIVVGRALGYRALRHRYTPRAGYVDTLVFRFRSDMIVECRDQSRQF